MINLERSDFSILKFDYKNLSKHDAAHLITKAYYFIKDNTNEFEIRTLNLHLKEYSIERVAEKLSKKLLNDEAATVDDITYCLTNIELKSNYYHFNGDESAYAKTYISFLSFLMISDKNSINLTHFAKINGFRHNYNNNKLNDLILQTVFLYATKLLALSNTDLMSENSKK
jgi:hypothetical protein